MQFKGIAAVMPMGATSILPVCDQFRLHPLDLCLQLGQLFRNLLFQLYHKASAWHSYRIKVFEIFLKLFPALLKIWPLDPA